MAHIVVPPSGYAPARSPAAWLGAIGIPAGFGALLIAGLAVTVIIEEADENPDAIFYKDPEVVLPPPPPPEDVVPEQIVDTPVPQVTPPAPDVVVAPDAPLSLGDSPPFEIAGFPDLPLDPVTTPTGLGSGAGLVPNPVAIFDPIAATPRNDPSRWIVERDYRSIWIRREMTGIARFTLTIDASGRVTDCTITRSTSHSALDQASCALITKRARFNPARDSSGDPTAGVYSSSVRWALPE